MRPERILLVTHEFPPVAGGIGTHCYEMAKHWASSATVTVATLATEAPRAPAEFPFSVVEISCPRGQGRRVWELARGLRRLVAASRPDLVYSGHWRATGVAVRLALAAVRRKPEYAQAVHGSEVLYLLQPDVPRGHGPLFRWTTSRAKRLIALGSYQGEILTRLGVERDRVLVSPEGVDVERFERVDERALASLRERHRLDGRFVILTVGRLVERKGQDTVLRALPGLTRSLPEVLYLVVGEGPYEGHLRSLARELGVEDSVIFCGRVPEDELVAYYHSCDVFVMMSRELPDDTEGFGIAFLEAAACGKPAIGGLSGGVPDAVVDGHTGILIEPTAVDRLIEVIVGLEREPALAGRLGEAGRRRVYGSYLYRDIAASILDGITAERPWSHSRGVHSGAQRR